MQTTSPSLTGIIQQAHNLLNDSEAANFLKLAPGTLPVWRCTKRYKIPYIKVGRLVRYRRSDLEAWLESRTLNNGGE